jgi:hypothetical protein
MTRLARFVSAWAVAAPLLALAPLGACGKGESAPSGFNGRFRGTVGEGGEEIALSTSGSTVKMSFRGEEVEGRLVSPTRAEGSKTSEEGTFRFAFDLQGNDKISAKFTIVVGGQTIDLPATTLERVVDAPASGGGSGGSGAREAALVGHWRHTEVLGSGDSHLVTDTHLVLAADGTFEQWSKSAGMGSSSESERTRGRWKAEGGSLHFRDEGQDWVLVGRYAVSGDNLMITGSGGGKRVYERV